MHPNQQKGAFFWEVNKLLFNRDFSPFRQAVNHKAEVYSALDTEYDKLINIRKIIKLLEKYESLVHYQITKNIHTEDKQDFISVQELETIIEDFKDVHKLPYFKYNPNVYKSSSIAYTSDICEVCDQESSFLVEGPYYGINELEMICVHCVASGILSEHIGILHMSRVKI
jgi:hypothetical protein